MAAKTLEQRVTDLEATVELLVGGADGLPSPVLGWKRIIGVYQDDPAFDEAERLGREWRESFRPQNDELAPL